MKTAEQVYRQSSDFNFPTAPDSGFTKVGFSQSESFPIGHKSTYSIKCPQVPGAKAPAYSAHTPSAFPLEDCPYPTIELQAQQSTLFTRAGEYISSLADQANNFVVNTVAQLSPSFYSTHQSHTQKITVSDNFKAPSLNTSSFQPLYPQYNDLPFGGTYTASELPLPITSNYDICEAPVQDQGFRFLSRVVNNLGNLPAVISSAAIQYVPSFFIQANSLPAAVETTLEPAIAESTIASQLGQLSVSAMELISETIESHPTLIAVASIAAASATTVATLAYRAAKESKKTSIKPENIDKSTNYQDVFQEMLALTIAGQEEAAEIEETKANKEKAAHVGKLAAAIGATRQEKFELEESARVLADNEKNMSELKSRETLSRENIINEEQEAKENLFYLASAQRSILRLQEQQILNRNENIAAEQQARKSLTSLAESEKSIIRLQKQQQLNRKNNSTKEQQDRDLLYKKIAFEKNAAEKRQVDTNSVTPVREVFTAKTKATKPSVKTSVLSQVVNFLKSMCSFIKKGILALNPFKSLQTENKACQTVSIAKLVTPVIHNSTHTILPTITPRFDVAVQVDNEDLTSIASVQVMETPEDEIARLIKP